MSTYSTLFSTNCDNGFIRLRLKVTGLIDVLFSSNSGSGEGEAEEAEQQADSAEGEEEKPASGVSIRCFHAVCEKFSKRDETRLCPLPQNLTFHLFNVRIECETEVYERISSVSQGGERGSDGDSDEEEEDPLREASRVPLPDEEEEDEDEEERKVPKRVSS